MYVIRGLKKVFKYQGLSIGRKIHFFTIYNKMICLGLRFYIKIDAQPPSSVSYDLNISWSYVSNWVRSYLSICANSRGD